MALFMSFEKAKDVQFLLEERLRAAKEVFLDFPKNKFGVTPDNIRFGHDYRTATRNYDNAYRALNTFNDQFEKEFKAEILKEKQK